MMSEPLLQLSGVHTHIGPYHILQGVDLTVPKGGVSVLLGRNGAGKTTTAAKLGLWMRKRQNRKVLLAACDLQRPGAVDQLVTLGKQLEIDVHAETPGEKGVDPVSVAKRALKKAKEGGAFSQNQAIDVAADEVDLIAEMAPVGVDAF